MRKPSKYPRDRNIKLQNLTHQYNKKKLNTLGKKNHNKARVFESTRWEDEDLSLCNLGFLVQLIIAM